MNGGDGMNLASTIKFLCASESTRSLAMHFADLADELFAKMIAKEKPSLKFKTELIHTFLALNDVLANEGFEKIEANSEKEIAAVYLRHCKEVINERF